MICWGYTRALSKFPGEGSAASSLKVFLTASETVSFEIRSIEDLLPSNRERTILDRAGTSSALGQLELLSAGGKLSMSAGSTPPTGIATTIGARDASSCS